MIIFSPQIFNTELKRNFQGFEAHKKFLILVGSGYQEGSHMTTSIHPYLPIIGSFGQGFLKNNKNNDN